MAAPALFAAAAKYAPQLISGFKSLFKPITDLLSPKPTPTAAHKKLKPGRA